MNKMDIILYSFPNIIYKNDIIDTNGVGDSFFTHFLSSSLKNKIVKNPVTLKI